MWSSLPSWGLGHEFALSGLGSWLCVEGRQAPWAPGHGQVLRPPGLGRCSGSCSGGCSALAAGQTHRQGLQQIWVLGTHVDTLNTSPRSVVTWPCPKPGHCHGSSVVMERGWLSWLVPGGPPGYLRVQAIAVPYAACLSRTRASSFCFSLKDTLLCS